MTKNTLCTILLTALWSSLAVPAMAQTEWRTQVQVSTGSGPGGNLEFAFDGGLNEPSSTTSLSNPLGAFGEASSALNASGFIPTLRARAVSGSDRAQAVAWGVQLYTNTTGSPIDTALVLQLEGDIVGSNDLEARIYLFQDENFSFSTNPGTMLFESSSQLWPGFEPFANNLGPTGFDIDINNTPAPSARRASSTSRWPLATASTSGPSWSRRRTMRVRSTRRAR